MNFIKILKTTLKLCLNVLLCNLIIGFVPVEGASTFEALSQKDQDTFKNLYHFYNNKIHADSSGFYLTPMEDFNISHEYIVLLETLKSNPLKPTGHFNYPLKCVVPARVEFLKSVGELEHLSLDDCKELVEWKKGLQAKSLSVVFSSSYPNNPSSMFGHTLIRLKSEKGSEILDYSVAFSAWQEATDSGFLLAIKGLFGGYRGLIELTKYYQKVNEYNYYESRDLIDYPLKMTPLEVERFLNHLWEIYQTTYFDYYFADENCSSLLYRIFIVAFRDHELPKEKRKYFLPRELVENLVEANVVDLEKVSVRGSLKKHFFAKYSQLDDDEKKDLERLRKSPHLSKEELNRVSVNTLESAKDFFYYKKAREKGNLDIEPVDEKKRLHDILVERSLRNDKVENTSENHFTGVVYPHLAHGPGSFNLGVTNFDQKKSLTLGFGVGFHDFTDSIKGNEAHQNFEILQSKMRFNEDEIRLQNLTVIDLKSLHPFTFYDPQASWVVEIKYQDEFYQKKIDASFGGGLAFSAKDHWMYGFLILPTAEYHTKFSNFSLRADGVSFISFNHDSDRNFYLEARQAFVRTKLENEHFRITSRGEWTYQLNRSINLELKQEKKLSSELFWSYRF